MQPAQEACSPDYMSYLAARLPPGKCATLEDQADAQPQDAVYKKVLYATV